MLRVSRFSSAIDNTLTGEAIFKTCLPQAAHSAFNVTEVATLAWQELHAMQQADRHSLGCAGVVKDKKSAEPRVLDRCMAYGNSKLCKEMRVDQGYRITWMALSRRNCGVFENVRRR